MVYWLITGLATAVLVVFAVSNLQPVEVNFWPLTIDTRLYLVVLVAMALGFFIGEIVAWIGGRRWRREARHRAQRIAALERELAATQARLEAGAGARHCARRRRFVPGRHFNPLTGPAGHDPASLVPASVGYRATELHVPCVSSVPPKSSPPSISPA